MTRRTQTVRMLLTRLAKDIPAQMRRLRVRLEKLPIPIRRFLRRTTFWSANTMVAVALVFSLVLVGAHLWLPTLADRKTDIETYVSKAIGNPVSFERLTTFWDGLNPGVFVEGFQVRSARTADVAVRLKSVRLTLAWLPLISGNIEIASLLVTEPNLVVERRADGSFHVTGFDLARPESDAPQDFTAWLFRQRELSISNGRMVWTDQRDTDQKEPLIIERLNVLLRNDGNRHRVDFHAVFPKSMCIDCRFSIDIEGKNLAEADWSGDIRANVQGLRVGRLPSIVRERLPAGIDGVVDLRGRSEWANGRPVKGDGALKIADARIPNRYISVETPIHRVSTQFRWSRSGQTSELILDKLQIGLTREPWSAGRARIRLGADSVEFEADHLDVGDVATWVTPTMASSDLVNWLRVAKPAGSVDRLVAAIEEKTDGKFDYQVKARLRNWRFAPHDKLPGVRNLGGQLTAKTDEGEIAIDSRDLKVELPRVFDKPVSISTVTSRINWRLDPEDFSIKVAAIDVRSPAGHVTGDVDLKVPLDKTLSPIIRLQLAGDQGNGRYTSDFIPRFLPEKLRQYLEQSVRAGTVTRASATLQGPIRNFPFRDGTGTFEIMAHVMDGEFEFLPGWDRLSGIEADLYFTGKEMLITGHRAQIRNVRIDQVVAAIEDFRADGGASISLGARGQGGLDNVLKVLADSGSPRIRSWIVPGLRADGDGTFYLALRIPTRMPSAFNMDGEFRLTRNVLTFPVQSLKVTDLRGTIGFGETGPQRGRITGQFLHGDASLETRIDERGVARLVLDGSFPGMGIEDVLGPQLGSYFAGPVPWRGEVRLLPDSTEWSAALDLGKLQISLPAPLAKARDEALTLEMRTVPGGNRTRMPIQVQAGARLNGNLILDRAANGWELSRGRLGVGERAGPVTAQRGLHVGLRSASLNADEWWSLIRSVDEAGSQGGISGVVARLTAETDALEIFGRPFGGMRADLYRTDAGWHGQLNGEAAVGQFVLATGPKVKIRNESGSRTTVSLDLDRLRLPGPGTTESKSTVDPSELPEIHIRSRSFLAGPRDFGSLELSGHPQAGGWRVDKFALVRPEASANIEGAWSIDRFGKQSSRFDLSVTSRDFGTTLAALGHGSEAVGGKLTLEAQWSWPDSPTALELDQLSGEMSFKLSQGRLLRVEPGAGRVLGFFDIMTIPRYLTLDFSSIFGKGLSYNTIESSMEIENGDAFTRNFNMNAPGANIDLNGKIGLATQSLDLEMGVTPKLMEELAITGGLIGGPAVGAAVAVLHTLVKKPLEKNTRIPYKVTGSWQHPLVVAIETPGAQAPLPP